jgi:hypothetical protein
MQFQLNPQPQGKVAATHGHIKKYCAKNTLHLETADYNKESIRQKD